MSVRRFTAQNPCAACGGHSKLPQGAGVRCYGMVTGDGWFICTREGGGNAKYHDGAQGWSHRVSGRCPCGETHREDPSAPLPAARRAPVTPIGDAAQEIVATYDYRDREGRMLYQVVRYRPKSFRQRRPHPTREGEWVWHMISCADYRKQGKRCDCGLPALKTTLYRIPDLVAGLAAGDTVYVVEGEKDADALHAAQQVATTHAGGVGKWRDELAGVFARYAQPGGRIVIVQDRDPELHGDGRPNRKGQIHARAVYDSIRAAVPETVDVEIVEAREGKDAADHLAAGLGVEAFVRVYPPPPLDVATDPAGFKRAMLLQAVDMTVESLEIAALDTAPENPPTFRSPLRGANGLHKMQGVVTVAGAPSSGKSYFAIGTAVDNALDPTDPWDVFYITAELPPEYVFDRVVRAAASYDLSFYECMSPDARARAAEWAKTTPVPARFTLIRANVGVTMGAIVAQLADLVGERPTLVILDSISSLVDAMDEVKGDNFGMSNLRAVQRYATAVRAMTRGHVAWLILSELNKEGRAKGRSLDHRSDLAIAMTPDPENGRVKRINVTKSWFSETGPLGEFALQHEIARLSRLEPDGGAPPISERLAFDD